MPAYSVTVSSATTSQAVPINLKRYKQGVGLIVTLSSGANLTVSVQVTGDNIFAPGYTPASGKWNNHDDLNALTASANGNLAYPVTAVRLNVTPWVGGSVTLSIVQAED